MPRREDYNATVIQRMDLAPGSMIIRIKPDKEKYTFEAGQYTVLGMKYKEPRVNGSQPDPKPVNHPDQIVKRAYSIASTSLINEYVDIFLVLVPDGELTPRLFNLKMGDRLFVGPKATGFFTLDHVPDDKNLLLIATGTGLAPYISIIRTYLHQHMDRRFVILHGSRYSWEMGYYDELCSLAKVCPHFTYIPSITRPQEDEHWTGLTGRIPNLLDIGIVEDKTGLEIKPDVFNVFLCGNPDMIDKVTEMMSAKGFIKARGRKPGTLHTEEYW